MKDKVPIRKRILFSFFDKVVNMTPTQIRNFRNSEEAKNISQTEKEAYETGGIAGKEVSPDIERIISKASKYRGQYKEIPDWTPKEWKIVSSLVRFIARFRKLSNKFVDEDGNETPLTKSMKIWGHDILKYKKHFPKSQEVKTDVKEYVKSERAKAKKERAKKLNEDFELEDFILDLDLDI